MEAKAALYDRLCGGEGLRRGGSDDSEGEEEEEGRYMVDFTWKIAEEVKSTCTPYMGSPYTLPSYYTSVLAIHMYFSMTCTLYMYCTPFVVCIYMYIHACVVVHHEMHG